jgi:ribonuclease H / adenosylcobalamin/alpha-ribazole phosphatase
MHAELHTDGGARGNPGPAGIGVVLTGDSGQVIGELAEALGVKTNNEAEYLGLIAGLGLAKDKGVTQLDVFMDSKLVVCQMRGEWKIKSDTLRQLAVQARKLARDFEKVTFNHVRREHNSGADRLANQAMDAAALDEELDVESRPEQGSLLE